MTAAGKAAISAIEHKENIPAIDQRSIRGQLTVSIGFPISRNRDLLRRLLKEQISDATRDQIAKLVVEHLEQPGVEIDEPGQALAEAPELLGIDHQLLARSWGAAHSSRKVRLPVGVGREKAGMRAIVLKASAIALPSACASLPKRLAPIRRSCAGRYMRRMWLGPVIWGSQDRRARRSRRPPDGHPTGSSGVALYQRTASTRNVRAVWNTLRSSVFSSSPIPSIPGGLSAAFFLGRFPSGAGILQSKGDQMVIPGNTVLARVSPLTEEVQLRIAEDPVGGIVVIEVDGLLPGVRVVLAPNHALDLSLRLTEACGRLMKAKVDQRRPVDAGPLGSTF